MEIWKSIKGYEGLYEVSDEGRIKSLSHIDKRGRLRFESILKDRLSDRGYCSCVLYNNGKSKPFKVHRLVANSFIENNFNKPDINHIDGDKKNNRIDNLEWVTKSENCKHAWKKGLNYISCERGDDGRFLKKQILI
jgi:hypothetical protein